MKNNHALNAKIKLLRMLLAFAEYALLFAVKCVENIIDFKISLTKTIATIATQQYLKKEPENANQESMNPNLLKSTMLRLQKNMKDRTSYLQKSRKKKTPLDSINICKRCAQRKNMAKAERVWIREGVCDFCLDRTYICQAIDYMAMDATKEH